MNGGLEEMDTLQQDFLETQAKIVNGQEEIISLQKSVIDQDDIAVKSLQAIVWLQDNLIDTLRKRVEHLEWVCDQRVSEPIKTKTKKWWKW